MLPIRLVQLSIQPVLATSKLPNRKTILPALPASASAAFPQLQFSACSTSYKPVSRTKRSPSPSLSLPLIGHLYLFRKPLHKTLANISNRFGPILYLHFGSRPVLLVSSPSAAEECFTKNDITFANRPQLLTGKHLGYNYTNIAWASYGPHWRNLRRISTLEIFSTNRLQMYSGIRADEVGSMIKMIYNSAPINGDYRTVDMKLKFFELIQNIMMMMIAGKRYYCEKMTNVDEAMEFYEILKDLSKLSDMTNIGDFVPVLRWMGFKEIENMLIKLKKRMDDFMQELIEEHRRKRNSLNGSSDGETKKTMIDVLLSLQDREPQYHTDEMIKGTISVLLAAGTGTTAGTMEWAMALLLNHPSVLTKAQAEIDLHVGHDRLLDESDLAKLPYLDNIIMETLRIYPAGPLLLPHQASKECTVGGYNVPLGTILLVNVSAIQNDPKVWEEPTKFKPERFEGTKGGEKDGFKLLPFSSGRRGCPGESLAMRVMGMALGSLIQCFEWERPGQEMVDMTEGTGLTVSKSEPLLAKCRPRPTMVNLLK